MDKTHSRYGDLLDKAMEKKEDRMLASAMRIRENMIADQQQKALEKSWAKVFADEIVLPIDETRFSVLYSNKASRPNTPVNVIVGALIIKELFDYSDDEMVENLMLDFRLQYALHTTSFEEQPLRAKTLTRFRRRCCDYEKLHNKGT